MSSGFSECLMAISRIDTELKNSSLSRLKILFRTARGSFGLSDKNHIKACVSKSIRIEVGLNLLV